VKEKEEGNRLRSVLFLFLFLFFFLVLFYQEKKHPTSITGAHVLSSDVLDPKNLKALQSILLYHVLSGAVPSIDLGPRQELATVDGASVLVVKNTTGTYPNPIVTHVYVNQAEVMTADILCTNGYVHIIDQVLLPPGLELV
jgi:hypothetical protein